MNVKKNTAVSVLLAVTTTSSPVLADNPGIDGEVYASLRIGIASNEFGIKENPDYNDAIEVVSRFSRVGFKGEAEIGNGVTAFGHYETEADIVNTNKDGDKLKTRLGYGGIKGDWGNLRLGQDYHTFYNYNVGAGDIPWNYAGFAVVNYRGRTEQTLTYDGSFGAAGFGVSLVLGNDSTDNSKDDGIDETELGFSYNLGAVTLAAAAILDHTDDAEDTFGLAANGSVGPAGLYLGYQERDLTDAGGGKTQSSITFDITVHDFYLHIEQFSDDTSGAPEPNLFSIGYTLELNDQASIWFEYADYDDDADNSASEQNFEVIFKYDISSKDFRP